MALSFPLSLAQFWSKLPIVSGTFDLTDATQQSQTRGGEIISATLGNRLWASTVTLGWLPLREAEEMLSLLDALREAGASFMAGPWPWCPPPGSLAGSSPKLHTVAANNCEIRISDLPANFAVPAGTFVSFAYGGSPVRYALHRTVAAGAASGAGLTPAIEVRPHVRPGFVTSTAVSLARPACKMVLVPGSVRPGTLSGRGRLGITFSAIQTLR